MKSIYANHSRSWGDHYYVYPVISRRSGGLSIGINLNPDKTCNFNCIYCQVDRNTPPTVSQVDLDRLRTELQKTIQPAITGALFDNPPFNKIPKHLRQIKDIAFSGDGEPTTSPQFPAAVEIAADIRRSLGLDHTKLVLITNAACLNQPAVRQALKTMDANNGEIWAKLDAGTEDYFRSINRPNVSLLTILDNILEAGRIRPIVIQSLWMKVHGSTPSNDQIDAFARQLKELIDRGGQIKLVQIYTVARQPAEPFVAPLTQDALDTIAKRVKTVVDIPTATYSP
ncbi:MAG: radical SAM protein [Planctomycetota bacterium]|nr:MAG: radical SAM protein [Planctomycetota bacterium]